MADVIVIMIIVLIVGVAVGYIVKEKKRGTKCIGCPAASSCPSANAGKCSCNSQDHIEE